MDALKHTLIKGVALIAHVRLTYANDNSAHDINIISLKSCQKLVRKMHLNISFLVRISRNEHSSRDRTTSYVTQTRMFIVFALKINM